MRGEWRQVFDAVERTLDELAPVFEQEEGPPKSGVEAILRRTHDEAHAAREKEKRAQATLIVEECRAAKNGEVSPIFAASRILGDAAFLVGTLAVERKKVDAVLRHAYAEMIAEVEAGTPRIAAERLAAEIAAVIERETEELARWDAIDDRIARAQSARRRELVRGLAEARERILAVRRELDAIL